MYALCGRCLEHGGEISCSAAPEGGACLRIELPRRAVRLSGEPVRIADRVVQPALRHDEHAVDGETVERAGKNPQHRIGAGADRGANTEDDVRELARALTGWRADWSDTEGLINFRFDATRWDSGTKTVFGKTGAFDWHDASLGLATCIYLFHELPPEVLLPKERERVAWIEDRPRLEEAAFTTKAPVGDAVRGGFWAGCCSHFDVDARSAPNGSGRWVKKA